MWIQEAGCTSEPPPALEYRVLPGPTRETGMGINCSGWGNSSATCQVPSEGGSESTSVWVSYDYVHLPGKCASLSPRCPPLPCLQLSCPAHSGSPPCGVSPALCVCSSLQQATWCRPAVSSLCRQRPGRAGPQRVAAWLAALAACLAASLTGCQLAPACQGLFLGRVCSGGRGAKQAEGTRHGRRVRAGLHGGLPGWSA